MRNGQKNYLKYIQSTLISFYLMKKKEDCEIHVNRTK